MGRNLGGMESERHLKGFVKCYFLGFYGVFFFLPIFRNPDLYIFFAFFFCHTGFVQEVLSRPSDHRSEARPELLVRLAGRGGSVGALRSLFGGEMGRKKWGQWMGRVS